MNLRLPADEETPAASIVCMINLDRRINPKATVRKLLKLVSLEMAVVKRCRLGLAFHHVLGIARRLRCLPSLLPTDRCLSTCVLSNLGEPLSGEQAPFGGGMRRSLHTLGLTLESLALLPPSALSATVTRPQLRCITIRRSVLKRPTHSCKPSCGRSIAPRATRESGKLSGLRSTICVLVRQCRSRLRRSSPPVARHRSHPERRC
jgi:hypothetical protein